MNLDEELHIARSSQAPVSDCSLYIHLCEMGLSIGNKGGYCALHNLCHLEDGNLWSILTVNLRFERAHYLDHTVTVVLVVELL